MLFEINGADATIGTVVESPSYDPWARNLLSYLNLPDDMTADQD